MGSVNAPQTGGFEAATLSVVQCLCCLLTNRSTNQDLGCNIEAKTVTFVKVPFYLAHDLIVGIAAGLPVAVFDSHV
jgi:hypothetical protein